MKFFARFFSKKRRLLFPLQRSMRVTMNDSMLPITPASVLGHRYFPHIGDICAFLAVAASRYQSLSPLLMLVWFRLRNTVARIDRLAARWQQGRLRPPRKCVRGERKPPPAIHPADALRARRAPQGRGWLIRLHQPMVQLAPRIELMLADPDIIALCAAAPQAGRLLRPLCRMFAIPEPAYIARPPRPRPPRKPRPRKPAPPPFAEHSPSQWPFVPLRLRLRVPGLPRRKPPD